jgi:HNH endonuclease
MAKTVITSQKGKYILSNYLKFPSRKIARKLKVSKTAVLGFLKRNNLTVPLELISLWKSSDRTKPYTKKEHQYIKVNIAQKSIKQIALELGRSSTTLQKEVHVIGLTDIIEQKKRDSYIQKGNIPPNKGKKLEDFMNPETLRKFKANQYKKNNIPHNALPEFAEVERQDKTGRIYVLIKVPGQRTLQLKHRVVWELNHKRKVPEKHKIIFKDGNTKNFLIENLECISYEEQMIKNSLHKYPEDLKEILFIKSAVTRQINKHKKNDNRIKD